MALCSMLDAHFLRMVPSSALAGLVAPISLRRSDNSVFFIPKARATIGPARHEIGERNRRMPARVYERKTAPPDAWIFPASHGENAEAILLELFDDVADRAFGNGVRFHEG